MRIQARLAAAVALLGVAAPAHAATVIGQLSFTGYVRPVGGTGMATATGLDFYSFGSPLSGDLGTPGTITSVLGGTGIFTGAFCLGPCGTIQDLPTFSTGAINSFFNIQSVVYFDLATIKSVTRTPDGLGGGLKVIASGIFRIAGYDPTPGVMTLTTQGSGLTSFSATAVNAVPEPASWAMMIAGFGMAGAMLRTTRRVRVRYATR
ncbi:PEPxxWA-CTERM sorting domain-containing protein [Sphingomonas sp. R1]|uniref:PEPxxWA-CTERM sorting domain-containing protein n=1 Tax=Sphingomonas sp. R1 TaxID=399176 RepID=UPI002224E747|nr:PEPxxWA-CTERM sorting domain-containing protein [Sphingomonas sp. R1]UYY76471.1 PEPxxWA-CTERM sorting domain-containing protein [Sphingomonas sp. R1]